MVRSDMPKIRKTEKKKKKDNGIEKKLQKNVKEKVKIR